jgi:hypothetical protein
MSCSVMDSTDDTWEKQKSNHRKRMSYLPSTARQAPAHHPAPLLGHVSPAGHSRFHRV